VQTKLIKIGGRLVRHAGRLVYLKAYRTVAEARVGINAYLEFYNQQRPNYALDYRTPAEVYLTDQEAKEVMANEAGPTPEVMKPNSTGRDTLNLALRLS